MRTKKSKFFFFFWLHWVSLAAHGLSLVAVGGRYSWLQCTGFSLCRLLLLQSTGSVVVTHRPSCFVAQGILLDQRLNPLYLPHWQADSYPLSHQGSPREVNLYSQDKTKGRFH